MDDQSVGSRGCGAGAAGAAGAGATNTGNERRRSIRSRAVAAEGSGKKDDVCSEAAAAAAAQERSRLDLRGGRRWAARRGAAAGAGAGTAEEEDGDRDSDVDTLSNAPEYGGMPFWTLSPEQLRVVKDAMNGPEDVELASIVVTSPRSRGAQNKIIIKRKSMRCLQERKWLNDDVINFYLTLLQRQNNFYQRNNALSLSGIRPPRVFIADTQMYTQMLNPKTTNPDARHEVGSSRSLALDIDDRDGNE